MQELPFELTLDPVAAIGSLKKLPICASSRGTYAIQGFKQVTTRNLKKSPQGTQKSHHKCQGKIIRIISWFAGQEQNQAWLRTVESICLKRARKESAKLDHTEAMDPLSCFRIQYVLLKIAIIVALIFWRKSQCEVHPGEIPGHYYLGYLFQIGGNHV